MERLWDNSTETISVKACLENDYKETPDVILSDDILKRCNDQIFLCFSGRNSRIIL